MLERFILNGQYSSWASVKGRVSQASVLDPLFPLNIY